MATNLYTSVKTTVPEALCQTSTGERPLFFTSHGRPLYGVFHPGAKASGDVVAVFCHSLGLEHMTASRLETLGAREIATLGVPVLRYHARGHGDSAGDYQDVTFDSLVEDAMIAADYARELAGASKIIWIATRFGSLIAGEAVSRRDDTRALAMWEPVHRGRDFFRENLRNLLFSEVAQGQRPTATVDQLLARLDSDGRVEMFGTYLHRALYHSALNADLRRSLETWSGPTLLIQVQNRQRLSQGNEKLKAAIESRSPSAKVDVRFIAEEPAWNMYPHPPYFNEELVRHTGDWINGLA